MASYKNVEQLSDSYERPMNDKTGAILQRSQGGERFPFSLLSGISSLDKPSFCTSLMYPLEASRYIQINSRFLILFDAGIVTPVE